MEYFDEKPYINRLINYTNDVIKLNADTARALELRGTKSGFIMTLLCKKQNDKLGEELADIKSDWRHLTDIHLKELSTSFIHYINSHRKELSSNIQDRSRIRECIEELENSSKVSSLFTLYTMKHHDKAMSKEIDENTYLVEQLQRTFNDVFDDILKPHQINQQIINSTVENQKEVFMEKFNCFVLAAKDLQKAKAVTSTMTQDEIDIYNHSDRNGHSPSILKSLMNVYEKQIDELRFISMTPRDASEAIDSIKDEYESRYELAQATPMTRDSQEYINETYQLASYCMQYLFGSEEGLAHANQDLDYPQIAEMLGTEDNKGTFYCEAYPI